MSVYGVKILAMHHSSDQVQHMPLSLPYVFNLQSDFTVRLRSATVMSNTLRTQGHLGANIYLD